MDAANLLKPMLARGELRCIGATTLAEYRQHMEKDAAFERRFQQVHEKATLPMTTHCCALLKLSDCFQPYWKAPAVPLPICCLQASSGRMMAGR